LRKDNVALILFIVFVLILPTLTTKLVAQDLIVPDFTLTDIDGNEFSLSDYREKVVLLNFFATWCGYCKKEIQWELPAIYRYFVVKLGAPVVIISISVDPDYDTVERLQQFREEYEVPWMIARDTAGVSQKYDVRGLPNGVIIDQDGYIRYRHVGFTDRSILKEEIEELLSAEIKTPVASFTYSPTTPVVGETIIFNASASHDPDGAITSYEWNFGDGATDTGIMTTHSYAAAATYTVTLTVTDNDNALDNAMAEVTVLPSTVPVRDVAIIRVTASASTVTVGKPVSIIVVAKNEGLESESFDVTVYYDTTIIRTQTITNLASGASETLTLNWDTANVSPGTYMIKAVASTVTGETNTADNTRTGGTITIKKLSSTVSIHASPTTVTVGTSIIISGSISPVRSGATVEIQYTPSGGTWSTLTTVKTDANGQYSYTWSPTAGTYEIKAKTAADESDIQIVTVQQAPALSILPYLAAGIAIIIVAAMVVYVMRSRKPKPT